MKSSIIFIGSPETSPKNAPQNLKKLLFVKPRDLMFRIFGAFIPPFTKTYQKVYVDFLGPLLAILVLVAFLQYGVSFKKSSLSWSPSQAVLGFGVGMPLMCFGLCKLGYSRITLLETASLVGYAFFGHIATLFVSFLLFEEKSNFFFFLCLVLFGGLSTLRIAMVLLGTIARPAARLLICSSISIVNILFVVFLHFAYMHRTYVIP